MGRETKLGPGRAHFRVRSRRVGHAEGARGVEERRLGGREKFSLPVLHMREEDKGERGVRRLGGCRINVRYGLTMDGGALEDRDQDG